ncbi:MAG: hypothetical protein V3V14_02325, partial [Saprospiraceae bacterium]
MSMFSKLKNIFVLEDENDTKKAVKVSQEKTKEEVKKNTYSPPDITISTDSSKVSPPPSGKPNSKFINILLKAVEEGNLDGFDYIEYKTSLQSLSKMEMDEETKFKSALAMAKTMGATKEKLISSSNHYINILKSERTKFGRT